MYKYLKEYIEEAFTQNDKTHLFYKVSNEDMKLAEETLSMKFPSELRAFYQEIGYGWFYDQDECYTDVLMKPQDIVDFRLGSGVYVYNEEREYLGNEDLVFFEVDTNMHIYTNLQDGKVYLGKREIASSIESFIKQISEHSNYFFA